MTQLRERSEKIITNKARNWIIDFFVCWKKFPFIFYDYYITLQILFQLYKRLDAQYLYISTVRDPVDIVIVHEMTFEYTYIYYYIDDNAKQGKKMLSFCRVISAI